MLMRVHSPAGMKHGARTVSSIPMTRELGGVSRVTGGDDPRIRGPRPITLVAIGQHKDAPSGQASIRSVTKRIRGRSRHDWA